MKTYAFALIHFGNNPKYLEYELYFLMNLKKNTIHDILYLYSIHDTPYEFVEIIKNINIGIQTIGYDDKGITFDINDKFISGYDHFNTLRTCNFIYAYQLTQYKKVCILESDMVIMKNIDSIFDLKCPSVFYTMNKNTIQKDNSNYLIHVNRQKMIDNCKKGTPINGGVLLLKPELKMFKYLRNKIIHVIKNNCSYPNETLMISNIEPIYNLPIIYNFSHYRFRDFNVFKNICIVHYNQSTFKPLDVIKEKYKEKKEVKRKLINYYKKNIYDPFHIQINKLLENKDIKI